MTLDADSLQADAVAPEHDSQGRAARPVDAGSLPADAVAPKHDSQGRAARPRGRYAPSPTGRLHLGNARTALLSWIYTRQRGGVYVLRIEDNDPLRSRPELEQRIYRDLAWLGIDWDEGPDVGGAFGPYRQSERGAMYAAALARLETYECSCSRRDLQGRARRSAGGELIYPGTCREGLVLPGRPSATRWRAPPGLTAFEDLVHGSRREDVREEVGDFVLRRRDGAWAYQLAVVVDDGAMAIDHVIRGDDLLTSTARQLALQRALGLPHPTYAHVPLILGPDGAKLSKRHGAPDLSALREGGAAPERIVAALARSVGLVGPAVRRVSARELVGALDLGALAGQDSASRPLELESLTAHGDGGVERRGANPGVT